MTSLNSRSAGSFDNLDAEGTFGSVTTTHGFEHSNTVDTSMGVIHLSNDVEVSDPNFQSKKQVG